MIRHYAHLGDFERVSVDEDSRRQEAIRGANVGEPKQPDPIRAAIYRNWPGNYRELTGEFSFDEGESWQHVLVSNDGYVVTHGPFGCEPKARLLTIRSAHGEVVRELAVRDAMTVNDHQWLCRGSERDVRFAIDDRTLRMTMLVNAADWDAFHADHESVDVDLETGSVPAPERDFCPAPLLVHAEGFDGEGQLLLARVAKRVEPEYPVVASKARISGIVRARIEVGSDGRVASTTITKPLPFGLDQAVLSALPQWEFTPGEATCH